jgi:hypothetical protein
MSRKNYNNFSRQDGIDIRDLFNAKYENLLSIINANDKNYNQRFENVIDMTKQALNSAEKAVVKAEDATNKRFEGVNEFRETLSDQARNFLTRSEFQAKWENVEKDKKDNTALVIAILGIIISVMSLIIKLI